jgi:hypothetical protein
VVCSRVHALQETLSAGTIALEISGRNARVAAPRKRWDRPRAGLDLVLDQRGADMADLPGGASGLLVRGYKGKEADRLVTPIDSAVFSLVADLRSSKRWDRLPVGLGPILDQRGADTADLPAPAGCWCRYYNGKEADRLVTRTDPGVAGRRAARPRAPGGWDKMRRVIDERAAWTDFADVPGGTTGLLVQGYKGKGAGQSGLQGRYQPPRGAARPRAACRRGVGPVENAPRGAQGDRCLAGGDYMSQALNRLRATVSPPNYSPPMPHPPTATANGWRDRLEWDPRHGKGSFPILKRRRAQGSSPGYVRLANQRKTPSGGHHSWQADLAPGISPWRQIRGLCALYVKVTALPNFRLARDSSGVGTRISRQSLGTGTGRAMTACGLWRRSSSFRTGAWSRPLRILPGSGAPGVLRRSGMRREAAA